MSRQTALDNINLKNSGRFAHTEYSLEYHKAYLSQKTGLPEGSPELNARAYDRFAFDFLWTTSDGLIDWKTAGRVTDMGHASYAADGSDQRAAAESPFKTDDEVWAFDAVAEYGLPSFSDQVKAYESIIQNARTTRPNQLTTGGCYRSLMSGAIAAFGWEMLLAGAADMAKMEKVFDSFYRRTLFHMRAWAETSAEVIIQHDDFVWTSGMFLHPDVYRHIIIPRYAELWKPLHAVGKKVLFCSDGLITGLAEDVARAGADGFIFEPCNDFGFMAERFGQTHCLVGSAVDCRDLTFGKTERVRESLDRTFSLLQKCRGAIVAVGNHLPPNIPPDMMDHYFDLLLPRLNRECPAPEIVTA